MPSSRAPSTASKSASSPASWPWVRLRPRWRAQRPFPSITTATWRGMREASRSDGSTGLDRSPRLCASTGLGDGELALHARWSMAGDVAIERVRPGLRLEGARPARSRCEVDLLERLVLHDHEVVLDQALVAEVDRHRPGLGGVFLGLEEEVAGFDVERCTGCRTTAAATASAAPTAARRGSRRVDGQLALHAALPVPRDVAVVGEGAGLKVE